MARSITTCVATVLTVLSALATGHAQYLSDTYDCAAEGGSQCREVIPDHHGADDGILLSSLSVPSGICASPHTISQAVLVHTIWHGSGGEQPFADLSLRVQSPTGTWATATTQPDTLPPWLARTNPVAQWLTQPLSQFNGEPAGGAWTVELTDSSNSEYGALDGWALTFVCGPTPDVSVTATVPNAAESPLIAGEIMLTRSVTWPQPLEVTVTIGGSATPGTDYAFAPIVPTTYRVTIPGGQATTTLSVQPVPDAVADDGETVVLTVEDGLYYTHQAGTAATVTIYDVLLPANLTTSQKSVTDASGNATAEPSETLTYTIVVANSGDLNATNVIVTDEAPEGTTFRSGSARIVSDSTGGTPLITLGNGPADTQLEVTIDMIVPGGACTVAFDVTVDSDPTLEIISNVATISTDEAPPFDLEPAEIAVYRAPPQIPTLTTTSLTLLVLLLALSGAWTLWRR